MRSTGLIKIWLLKMMKRIIIVRLLNQIGFSKIIQAENGNIALDKLYLNQVNLIIPDWRMPDMDGLEFYKKAKQEGLIGDIPFLMVSAESHKEQITEALKTSVDDYILKPVGLTILRDGNQVWQIP